MTTQPISTSIVTPDCFTGKLVRLSMVNLEQDIELYTKWNQDSEFQQLLDWGPANLHSKQNIREWFEKDSAPRYDFFIHTLAEDKTIGMVSLDGINWTARDAWVGIGIGEHDYWGHGYGTEAMNLVLRFAFEELNLNRVSLDVFEYNERAIRSYEKVGFKHEGRLRQLLNRFDRRWDLIYMGILRQEWEETFSG